MAFTVTARHSANTATTSAQTVTTDSVTPTADSLLLVGYGAQVNINGTNDPALSTPTASGITWTLVAKGGEGANWDWAGGGGYEIGGGVWRTDIGSSPSAFTITCDGVAGTDTGNYHVLACDVTGHDTGSPIKASTATGGTVGSGGTGTNTGTGSVTLSGAPASGDLLIVWFGSASDGGGGLAAPTAGAGKTMTQLFAQDTAWTQGRLDYRICDGTESATIDCSDLGQTTGNWWATAVVVNPAAAGGPGPLILPTPLLITRR